MYFAPPPRRLAGALSPLIGMLLFPGESAALTINDATCTVDADNALRVNCEVETDTDANVKIRFCERPPSGCSKTRESDTVTGTHHSSGCTYGSSCYKYEVTIWNLISGNVYEWEAHAWQPPDSDTSSTYTFTPDSLPSPDLDDIDFTITVSGSYDTEYLAFNYACSSSSARLDYLVIADTDGNIVWYEDVRDVTGDTESRIVGLAVTPAQRFLVLVDDEWSISEIYDPSECDGLQPPGCGPDYWSTHLGSSSTTCDWSHANSIWTKDGDWLMSLKHLDRLIMVDGSLGTLDWELHGENPSTGGGDWDIVASPTVSPANFNEQHHAWWHRDNETIMLFDNHMLDTGSTSRGLEIELYPDTGDPSTGEYDVISEWDTTEDCGPTGSTFDILPGGHVVTTCADKDSIQEFDTSSAIVWELELSCPDSYPVPLPSRSYRSGVIYRARPVFLD